MTTIKLFRQVRIGQRFSFRFGCKGERGPCRRISQRRYVYLDQPTRVWSVAVTDIEVRV
jgi:hypothetical protein